MSQKNIISTHQQFSDLLVSSQGTIKRIDLFTFILEIITWTFVIFLLGFIIIFNPDQLSRSLPYIVLGMLTASTFWYLRMRTLYMRLHQEKLLNEKQYNEIRARQVELDKKEKEFIAMTSHQLNTPLSVVRNASAELMRMIEKNPKKFNEKEKKYLGTINDSSKRMVTYLNDLLGLIRSDTSLLELTLRPLSPKDMLDRVIKDLENKALNENVTIKSEIEAQIGEVIGDAERINMALINLLDNALTYASSNSTIKIRAQKNGNYVLFSVSDRGIGIPKEEQPHVFQRFYRASNSKAINKFGTGLGLSIARDIIIQQGGTIWFESKVGKNTTFYFTLPKV